MTDVTTEDRMMNNGERKERRGFASMSPEKQREIASKGGRAAHQKGTAHEWTSDEARNAGRKGGQISRGGRGRLVEPPITDSASTRAEAVGGERRAARGILASRAAGRAQPGRSVTEADVRMLNRVVIAA